MGKEHRFSGEFKNPLSNFYKAECEYEGLVYRNSEAAFQAAKVLDNETRKKFQNLNPSEAKRLGRNVTLRKDWGDVKYLRLFGKRVAYAIECILLLASAGIVITGVRKVGFPWESAIAFYAYFYFAIITILSIVLVVLARIARKECGFKMQKSSPVN